MKRRDVFLGLVFVVTTELSQAQQSAKVPRITFVSPLPLAEQREFFRSFFEELRSLGYVEGQNLMVEQYTSGELAFHNLELARDVINRKPEVIVAATNPLVLDFKAATSTIPIVGATADPVALGIVSNLARPEGNVTGVSIDAGIGMWGKRLDLLRDAMPKVSKVAFLGSRSAWSGPYGTALRETARQLGISLIGAPLDAPFDEAEYRRALTDAVQAGAEALIVSDFLSNFRKRQLIVDFAGQNRLPAIYPFPQAVEIGGLMAFAWDQADSDRHLADEVDLILRGTKPGEIPFYQPSKFQLLINTKAAQQIGLDLPPTLLARADKVIE